MKTYRKVAKQKLPRTDAFENKPSNRGVYAGRARIGLGNRCGECGTVPDTHFPTHLLAPRNTPDGIKRVSFACFKLGPPYPLKTNKNFEVAYLPNLGGWFNLPHRFGMSQDVAEKRFRAVHCVVKYRTRQIAGFLG
jgi:hypothetical protein